MPGENFTFYAKWSVLSSKDDSSDYTFTLLANDTYEMTGYTGTNTILAIPSIYLEKAVTSSGSYAFADFTSLLSITIPSSVTSIGTYAFYGCSILSSITFVSGSLLTSIGQGAFSGCNNLTSITIPSGVTNIGIYAFYNCSSLTIYVAETSIPSEWDANWNPDN